VDTRLAADSLASAGLGTACCPTRRGVPAGAGMLVMLVAMADTMLFDGALLGLVTRPANLLQSPGVRWQSAVEDHRTAPGSTSPSVACTPFPGRWRVGMRLWLAAGAMRSGRRACLNLGNHGMA